MKPADVLKKADNIIRFLLKTVTLCMFAVLMIMIALNVFNRLVPITSFHWLDEIIELCFAAMTFYGAAAVWIIKGHYSVGNWLENRITPPTGKAFLRILIDSISCVFFIILFRYSLNLMLKTKEVTAVFQIPRSVLYACMPISSAVMVFYTVAFIANEIIGICKRS